MPLTKPVRSNSQRHDSPMAIEPATAGTKYSARKTLTPRSRRLTMMARAMDRTMRMGVTSR